MTKGITYSFVDKFGTRHCRYSVAHTEPLYKFAAVNYGEDGDQHPRKSSINYSKSREGALSGADASWQDRKTGQWHFNVIAVVEVTATEGRQDR